MLVGYQVRLPGGYTFYPRGLTPPPYLQLSRKIWNAKAPRTRFCVFRVAVEGNPHLGGPTNAHFFLYNYDED
jgi:hypothetical protein